MLVKIVRGAFFKERFKFLKSKKKTDLYFANLVLNNFSLKT